MRIQFNDNWNFKTQDGFERVTLPHDAMIGTPRSKDAAGGAACAYFDGGVYVYEKQFSVPEDWRGKEAWLEFGGVYRNAKVFVNGQLAGEWAYGYTSFCVPLSAFLQYGKDNTVRVEADNSRLPNSRWYTGGGIYRPVALVVKEKTHICRHGITVATKTIAPATVSLSAERTGGEVTFYVYDGETLVASREGEGELTVPCAKLWSAEHPHLYTLKAVLKEGETVTDEETLSFGIRLLSWSPKGFFVNGEEVKLRGGCVHHDNGILGACAWPEAEERKVRIIKEAGYNAVRSSHNPCSEAFLEACDKYGVYLIDEFADMWYSRKKKYDYALDFPAWHERDLHEMVQKDKNHPSVVMYSLGNEVSEPHEEKGVATIREMADYVRSLDKTRPVTAGINFLIIVNAAHGKGIYSDEKVEGKSSEKKPQKEKATSSLMFNMLAAKVGPAMNRLGNSDEADRLVSPCLEPLDIAGYNYASGRYDLEGKKHPERVVFGSETFPQDIWRNWEKVKKYPYLIGDFMWTAWDYLGEVGAGGWSYEPLHGMSFEKPYPWIIADTGAIDLIGNIGAEAKYASTVWGLETVPYIAVRPVDRNAKKLIKSVWRGTNAIASWSWQGCEGRPAEIEVYSSAYKVELLLNGKKIGEKKLKECKAMFRTAYRPGELKAVAKDRAGKPVGESVLRSARSHGVHISCEETCVKAGGLAFFDVTLSDGEGNVECAADCRLTAEVSGGELLAFDSARQKTEEQYSSPSCETYYGRALLVVRAGESGPLTVRVTGCGEAELRLMSEEQERR